MSEEFNNQIITYKNDHGAAATKDQILSKLIPEQLTECAIHLGRVAGETCAENNIIKEVVTNLGVSNLSEAKTALACEDERCVLKRMAPKMGNHLLATIANNFKVMGPSGTQLLSNKNIDMQLQQWAKNIDKFFPYNFNMLNYTEYSFSDGAVINTPDTLATISVIDLHKEGYKYAGCVINSDVYQGPGKHWMALFVDCSTKIPSIEFFNSSGNPPAPQWVNWMEKTKSQLDSTLNVDSEIISVSKIRHQQSRTECGVYSLFYIWARLNKVPYKYFTTTPIKDQLMFEFRQHLFYDAKTQNTGVFNWKEFTQRVNIKWE
jgi:hypothetical protein